MDALGGAEGHEHADSAPPTSQNGNTLEVSRHTLEFPVGRGPGTNIRINKLCTFIRIRVGVWPYQKILFEGPRGMEKLCITHLRQ